MWFTNQSYHTLSSSFTCGQRLLISCSLNMSISCELGCICLSFSCLGNSGCIGLSGLNLTEGEACENVGVEEVVS